MHIGSQIVSVEPFNEAVEKLAQFVLTLRENGVNC